MSDEQIREVLRNIGWPEGDIQVAFDKSDKSSAAFSNLQITAKTEVQSAARQPLVTVGMKKNFPKKTIVITGVIVVLLIVGAAVTKLNLIKVVADKIFISKPSVPDIQAPVSTPAVSSSSEAPISETSVVTSTVDWKTYINKKFGFQLQLTDAWQGYKAEESVEPSIIVPRSMTNLDLNDPRIQKQLEQLPSTQVSYIDFQIPTQDKGQLFTSNGMYILFRIFAVPTSQYEDYIFDALSSEHLSTSSNAVIDFMEKYKLGEKNGKIFAYISFPYLYKGFVPQDKKNVDFRINQVAASFKFLSP